MMLQKFFADLSDALTEISTKLYPLTNTLVGENNTYITRNHDSGTITIWENEGISWINFPWGAVKVILPCPEDRLSFAKVLGWKAAA